MLEKIIIVDYGSQFTQLIARKVREFGVYSEIINFNQINKLKKDKNKKKGIILSAEEESSLHFTNIGANPINIPPRDSIKKKFAPCKFFNI